MARLEKGVNDLSTVNPELASEWDYEINGELTPEQVFPNSRKKVGWKIIVPHPITGTPTVLKWNATIISRNHGTGCPYLSGRAVLKGFNDLETLFPDLAKEWDYEANNGLINKKGEDISTPDKVTAYSNYKVFWVCKHNHHWSATISSRSHGDNGCPECNKATKTSFVEQSIYYYVKQYFNDALNDDRKVLEGKELDVYIPSIKTGIEYDGSFYHKDIEKDLKKNKLASEKGLRLIRIRDALCPLLSDNNSENIILPSKSFHDLEKVIKELLLKLGILSSIINIKQDYCYILDQIDFRINKKSLLDSYPSIAAEWHPVKNGKLKPEMVSYSSNKSVWWQCKQGHEWQSFIGNRTIRGRGCPLCSGRYAIKNETDLATTRPDLASEWHPTKNGDLTPLDVKQGSNKIVWWECNTCGQDWQASVRNRNRGCKKCPNCSNNNKKKNS